MEKKQFNLSRKISYILNYPNLAKWVLKNKFRTITGWDYHFMKNYSFPPLNIFLLPTGRCNLFCRMCDIGLVRSNNKSKENSSFYKNISVSGELKAYEYESFIKELATFNPKISITGGEPLLYGDIADLLYLITKKYRLITAIITNGLLLEKNAEMLIDSGLYEIIISIDGFEETVDKLRGVKGLYKNIIKGLEKLIDLKKQKNSLVKIVLNFTMLPVNVSEISKFVDFFSGYDIESITFFHMFYKNNQMLENYNLKYINLKDQYKMSTMFVEQINPKDMDIIKLAGEIKYVSDKYKNYKINFAPDISYEELENYYKNPDIFIFDKKCLMPWNSAQIVSNGDVLLSSICFNKSMGNITENSFLNIWNNTEYRKFRSILKKEGAFPVCSRCCNIFS